VSILTINRGILSQFWDPRSPFPFSSFLNPLFSSYIIKSVLEKRRSQTHSPLDRCEIWVPSSELISEHSHYWKLQKTCRAKTNTLCIIAFSFPAKTQNCLSKTTIPDSLTIELSWNFDMWLAVHFSTSSALGFLK